MKDKIETEDYIFESKEDATTNILEELFGGDSLATNPKTDGVIIQMMMEHCNSNFMNECHDRFNTVISTKTHAELEQIWNDIQEYFD